MTSSELVQRHLAGSRVVKAFNNISFMGLATLARPPGHPTAAHCPSLTTLATAVQNEQRRYRDRETPGFHREPGVAAAVALWRSSGR